MRLPGVCIGCGAHVIYNGVAWMNPGTPRKHGQPRGEVHRCRRKREVVSYVEGKHMPRPYVATGGVVRCGDCLQTLGPYKYGKGTSWRHRSGGRNRDGRFISLRESESSQGTIAA